MGLAAVFGHSDPECAALLSGLSEPCSVVASFDWEAKHSLGSAFYSSCLPSRILDHYALRPSDVSGDLGALLAVLVAAAGLASSPLPPGPDPSKARADALRPILVLSWELLDDAKSEILFVKQTSGSRASVFALAVGLGLRVVRLCLPYARESLEIGGARESFNDHSRVQWIIDDLLIWLSVTLEHSSPLSSLEACTDQHLTVLAEEAAAFILEAAAFLEEGASVRSGQGDESMVGYCIAIAVLLHKKSRGNPDSPVYSSKMKDRRFHEILDTRLLKSPPGLCDPSGSGPDSCFPLDPVLLLKNCLRLFSASARSTDWKKQSKPLFTRYIVALLDLLSRMPEPLALHPSRTLMRAGLLCALIRGISSLLRDPSARLTSENVKSLYDILTLSFTLLQSDVSAGRTSPIEFAKALSDAVSDLIYLVIALPLISKVVPDKAFLKDSGPLAAFPTCLCGIVTPLLANPVSRAELMRATMRSGTLDRLRAALRALHPQARTLPYGPAPEMPGIAFTGAQESCKRLFHHFFVLCLYYLGSARDRGPSGLAYWRSLASPLTGLKSAVKGGHWAPQHAGLFGFQLRFQCMVLRERRPNGAEVLDEEGLDLGPAISGLEQAASEMPEAIGSWAVQGVGEMVHALHGVAASGLTELEARLEDASEKLANLASNSAGPVSTKGNGSGKGRIKALASAQKVVHALFGRLDDFSAWRTRLRHLGQRLVVDSLPRAEERDAAVWVLSPEEVVGVMRGAGEGLEGLREALRG